MALVFSRAQHNFKTIGQLEWMLGTINIFEISVHDELQNDIFDPFY